MVIMRKQGLWNYVKQNRIQAKKGTPNKNAKGYIYNEVKRDKSIYILNSNGHRTELEGIKENSGDFRLWDLLKKWQNKQMNINEDTGTS